MRLRLLYASPSRNPINELHRVLLHCSITAERHSIWEDDEFNVQFDATTRLCSDP